MTRRGPRAGRTTVRPTAFGVVALAVLVAVPVLRPPVADVVVAGAVWVALAAALVLGALVPWVAMRSLAPAVAAGPPEGTVGEVVEVQLPLGRRAVAVQALVEGGTAPCWVPAGPPTSVRLAVPLARRGAFPELCVRMVADGPFGVVRASRLLRVQLHRELLVGPSPVAVDATPGALLEPGQGIAGAVAPSGEVVRGVRPYVPGDPAHLVHWPTTARTGAPAVRELDPPDSPGCAVVVDVAPPATDGGAHLPTDPPTGDDLVVEERIARAAGAALAVLAGGGRVLLCTNERGRPTSAEVADARTLSRRLANAGPGPVTVPPGWPRWQDIGADGAPADSDVSVSSGDPA